MAARAFWKSLEKQQNNDKPRPGKTKNTVGKRKEGKVINVPSKPQPNEETVDPITSVNITAKTIDTQSEPVDPLKLFEAVKEAKLGQVRSLLAAKCDPDAEDDEEGMTALMWAVSADNPDITRELIQAKASLNLRAMNDSTPMVAASATGSCRSLQLLIDSKADLNLAGTMLGTPLMWAAAENKTDAVKLLIESKARVNFDETKGEKISPLMWAAEQNSAAAAKLLIEKKADVDLQDVHGRTPAMIAAWNNSKDVIKVILFASTPDLDKLDKDKQSAVTLARMRKNYTMMNILDPLAKKTMKGAS